jgi:hypothetical protein
MVGLFILCLYSQAFSHGGSHVMGTVMAKTDQTLTVKTKEGQSVSIHTKKETLYRRGATTTTEADLHVGDRVVVETTKDGNTLSATEIRFSSDNDGKSAHETSHHEKSEGGER